MNICDVLKTDMEDLGICLSQDSNLYAKRVGHDLCWIDKTTERIIGKVLFVDVIRNEWRVRVLENSIMEEEENDPIDVCPHCGEKYCIADKVFTHAESYGGQGGHLPCIHCDKMIYARVHQTVIVDEVTKSDKSRDEGTW